MVNGKLVIWHTEFVVALMVWWREDLNCVVYGCSVVCLVTSSLSGEEGDTLMCADGAFFPSGPLGLRTFIASWSRGTRKKIPGREYCWFIYWEENLTQILMRNHQVRIAACFAIVRVWDYSQLFLWCLGTWWDLGCFIPWKAASCALVQKRDCYGTRCRWRVSGLIWGRILSRSCWGWEAEADSVIFISIYIMIFFDNLIFYLCSFFLALVQFSQILLGGAFQLFII